MRCWCLGVIVVVLGFLGFGLTHCSKESDTPEPSQEQVQLQDASVLPERDAGSIPEEPVEWKLRTYDAYTSIPSSAAMPKSPSVDQIHSLLTSKTDYTSDYFTGTEICSNCHDNLKDKYGADVSIVKSWSATMMALSARDPYWQAKVQSEMTRHPELKSVLADKCSRCHTPMASVEAKRAKKPVKLFGDGFLNVSNPFFHLAMDGVSCTLCHQIKDSPALGTLDGFSGKFPLDEFKSYNLRKVYGPYMDPLIEPMASNAGYRPTGSEHIAQSKLCASCHVLKTPFVDEKGKVVPKTEAEYFPEQMAYKEWLASYFSSEPGWKRSCQSCHVPRTQDVALSYGPPWITKREQFGQHIFVGGNLFMLQLMKDNKDLLGIRAKNFDFTIKKTATMLKSAARLRVESKSFVAGRLEFQVRVINLSGHKLPTGYPARRVFLHVKVENSQSKVVFESGKVLDHGHIVGVDADVDASKYEPHHQVITQPDQVQVYESIMANTSGNVTYTLIRAAKYLKDNRILPQGMKKEGAHPDIKVAGKAQTDTDFKGGADTVTYRIEGLPRGSYNITIALRYQSISYRSALDLFRDKQQEAVKRFLYLYLQKRPYVSTITSTKFSIQ